MKIYIAEQYHDNDCGVFSDKDMALDHFKRCVYCSELKECELKDGVAIPVAVFNKDTGDWDEPWHGYIDNAINLIKQFKGEVA